MKLITEHFDNLQYITEDKDGMTNTFIEGVFMQAEKKNRNGRIYPKQTLFGAVEKYINEQVNQGRAVGELDHPEGPQINLDRVSHKITALKFDGDDVVGRAQVLNTPTGKIVEGLIQGGVKLGVSSRGMGTVENKNGNVMVNDDYTLATVDIVQDPSAQGAFVNGIMEGVEWIWDNGILKAQQLEKYETEIREASSKELTSVQEKVFKDFLSKL
tara:strand:+ start:13300 stop:13941 length:642 start_codon:yes stop_codon:yes gene_type:complete